jgi:hypothetical protein
VRGPSFPPNDDDDHDDDDDDDVDQEEEEEEKEEEGEEHWSQFSSITSYPWGDSRPWCGAMRGRRSSSG